MINKQKKKISKKKGRKRRKVTQIISKPAVGPRVLLESSFLVACLDPTDSNYKCTKAVFKFMGPYYCRFHIPLYVYAEVLSKLIQKGETVAESLRVMDNFLKKVPGIVIIGSGPNIKEIKERYKQLARKKIRLLKSVDFYIATEGMLSGSLILTCDYEMYVKTRKYYRDIFYIATHSRKYKNGVPKFTKRFLDLS